MVNSGDSGLPAVDRAVAVLRRFTGAAGASYVEYGSAGGRVVSTAGLSDFARGRRVDPSEPEHVALLGKGPVIEADVAQLSHPLSDQLRVHGAARMLAS